MYLKRQCIQTLQIWHFFDVDSLMDEKSILEISSTHFYLFEFLAVLIIIKSMQNYYHLQNTFFLLIFLLYITK